MSSGDRIRFAGTISVTMTDGTHESKPPPFQSSSGSEVRKLAGPIDVVLRPALGPPSRVCVARAISEAA
jgi:hypothetical protein